MDRSDKINQLIALASGERQYLDGTYYRLKQRDDNSYKVERAVAGFCGDYTPSPAITFYLDDDSIQFAYFADYEAKPMQVFAVTEEKLDRVVEAFDELVDEFLSKLNS